MDWGPQFDPLTNAPDDREAALKRHPSNPGHVELETGAGFDETRVDVDQAELTPEWLFDDFLDRATYVTSQLVDELAVENRDQSKQAEGLMFMAFALAADYVYHDIGVVREEGREAPSLHPQLDLPPSQAILGLLGAHDIDLTGSAGEPAAPEIALLLSELRRLNPRSFTDRHIEIWQEELGRFYLAGGVYATLPREVAVNFLPIKKAFLSVKRTLELEGRNWYSELYKNRAAGAAPLGGLSQHLVDLYEQRLGDHANSVHLDDV